MGYYKNLEVEQQEKVDDIIRWWKSHEGQPMPAYLMKAIIEDTRFFNKVQFLWEGHVNAVMGQKRMTRKESEAILKRHNTETYWSMPWRDVRFIFIALMVSLIGNLAFIVYIMGVTL